jgi:hypothetical protein
MFKFSNRPMFVFVLSLSALVTGCGTTATISRVGSPAIEAQIQTSDTENLYVGHGAGTTLARSSISDIDHPGNVAATIGAIVTGYGIANIAIGASDCDRGGAAYCTGVFLPAAIGLPIMVYGIATYSASVNAAKPSGGKTEPSFAIVPTISVEKKNEYVGVAGAMRF